MKDVSFADATEVQADNNNSENSAVATEVQTNNNNLENVAGESNCENAGDVVKIEVKPDLDVVSGNGNFLFVQTIAIYSCCETWFRFFFCGYLY